MSRGDYEGEALRAAREGQCFVRYFAGTAVDLFDEVAAAEQWGDVTACAIMAELDRRYVAAGGPPEDGTLVTVCVQAGWFERDMPTNARLIADERPER